MFDRDAYIARISAPGSPELVARLERLAARVSPMNDLPPEMPDGYRITGIDLEHEAGWVTFWGLDADGVRVKAGACRYTSRTLSPGRLRYWERLLDNRAARGN